MNYGIAGAFWMTRVIATPRNGRGERAGRKNGLPQHSYAVKTSLISKSIITVSLYLETN